MQLNGDIWLDSHLFSVLAKRIQEEFGWKVKSSYILKPDGVEDEHVFLRAEKEGCVILTKDSDFSDIVAKHGRPPKIINLKTGNRKKQSTVGSDMPRTQAMCKAAA